MTGITDHARTGDRADLIATLRRFAADRADRGENERAADANAAADRLESLEEDVVYFERVIYAVGDAHRWSTTRGTRDEIRAQIWDACGGWDHFGKPALAQQARAALAELDAGADLVHVGHLLYEVIG